MSAVTYISVLQRGRAPITCAGVQFDGQHWRRLGDVSQERQDEILAKVGGTLVSSEIEDAGPIIPREE